MYRLRITSIRAYLEMLQDENWKLVILGTEADLSALPTITIMNGKFPLAIVNNSACPIIYDYAEQ